ncbi:S8 family serine peptidase [uncultured Sphingomonas sp.]|uniref:subtilisin-like serine protease QhpE n=1 Tax=uncultured Sphingomonas sp. TaxID=158754 RepID=UPI0025881F1F|nr:S8 family serine peptidase [uncultured Sphingomonas sp.]
MTPPTGRGIRVAIIDSGVHPRHPHIDAARLAGGAAVDREGRIDDAPHALLDRLGHGTAVTAAIQERAPDAELLTVRVFHDALRASAAALIAAIRWSIAARADIVNLSLGSTNPAHRDAFAAVTAEAAAAGVLIVAARTAGDSACWPGALPDVLGVDLDWDCPRATWRVVPGQNVVRAAGYPRPIEGVAPSRNLHGVSFAVAQITGMAACVAQRIDATDPPDRRVALMSAILAGAD